MRKSILAVVFSIFITGQLSAQDYSIGIKVGPSYSMTRPGTESTTTSIDQDGGAIRLLFGAFVDIGFKENYFFHTGLNYATKVTKISATPNVGGNEVSESYTHEYLQFPLLLKLYTSEISLDTKLFFNFGLIPELKLSTSNEEVTAGIIQEFRSFDLAGNIGAGLEKSIGPNTRLYGGLNFNLGFLNMVKDRNSLFDEFSVKSSLLAIEAGIKF